MCSSKWLADTELMLSGEMQSWTCVSSCPGVASDLILVADQYPASFYVFCLTTPCLLYIAIHYHWTYGRQHTPVHARMKLSNTRAFSRRHTRPLVRGSMKQLFTAVSGATSKWNHHHQQQQPQKRRMWHPKDCIKVTCIQLKQETRVLPGLT